MSEHPWRKPDTNGEPASEIYRSVDDVFGPDEDFLRGVEEHVRRIMLSDEMELPRVSSVAAEILNVARDPNADVDRVVSLIQTDPILTGKVLSLINSAYYSVRQDVLSLRHAIVLLGMNVVSDLVFTASMRLKVFRCPEYESLMLELWRHSVATAVATEVLAERNGSCEYGFMAGLLHDIGKTTLLSAIVETETNQLAGEHIGEEAAQVVMDQMSGRVGGLLARKWKLAGEIKEAIVAHGRFHEELPPLVSYVHCANKIVHHIGLGCEQIELVPSVDPGLRALNLNSAETFSEVVDTVADRAERLVDRI